MPKSALPSSGKEDVVDLSQVPPVTPHSATTNATSKPDAGRDGGGDDAGTSGVYQNTRSKVTTVERAMGDNNESQRAPAHVVLTNHTRNTMHIALDEEVDEVYGHYDEVYLVRNKRSWYSAVGQVIKKTPSWVAPSVISGILWTVHGVQDLSTTEFRVPNLFSILTLTSIERFYSTSLALILDQCFRIETLKTLLIAAEPHLHRTVNTYWGTKLRGIDVLFNYTSGRAGPVLHACSPMFKTAVSGLPEDRITSALSCMFDTSLNLDNVIYYRGLSKMIANEAAAYLNDITPRFASAMGTTSRRRRRRQTGVLVPHEYEPIIYQRKTGYSNGVSELINTPRSRYEFDVVVAAVYNNSADYIRNVRYQLRRRDADLDTTFTHHRLKVLPGVTIVEVLRSVDKHSDAFPRLNMLAELLDGYRTIAHFERVLRRTQSDRIDLDMASLRTLLYLFYLDIKPSDVKNAGTLINKEVQPRHFRNVLQKLYERKYSRIPMLVVVEDRQAMVDFQSMLTVYSRNTEEIKSWEKYSSIVVTTMRTLIPSAAFSLCISRKVSLPTENDTDTVFVDADLVGEQQFGVACDIASEHITYTIHMSEILANRYLPARLASQLSGVQSEIDFAKRQNPNHDIYDPVMTDLLAMVDQGHHNRAPSEEAVHDSLLTKSTMEASEGGANISDATSDTQIQHGVPFRLIVDATLVVVFVGLVIVILASMCCGMAKFPKGCRRVTTNVGGGPTPHDVGPECEAMVSPPLP